MCDVQQEAYVSILRKQVVPALGCTEPVAVALSVSKAAALVSGTVSEVKVLVSPNIYKNGMHVGIPGTTEKGLPISVALAVVCGDPEANLEVFRHVDDQAVREARTFLSERPLSIQVEEKEGSFYILAEVWSGDGSTGVCVIRDSHTNVTYLERSGVPIYTAARREAHASANEPSLLDGLKSGRLSDIRAFAEQVPSEDIAFLMDGVDMNMEMAEIGLRERSGIGIGYGIGQLVRDRILLDDMVNRAKKMTAAACDARMAGVNHPVMSSAGSGNHGLTAIIPVAVVCREMGYDRDKLLRALAISHLTTAYIKEYTGRLSPVCGCAVAAGIGAAVAITWLFGGSDDQMTGAVQNMVGSIAGMLCDGAKGGCALKLATAASEAVLQASLAVRDHIIDNSDGLVDRCAEETIHNLGRVCVDGMKEMDVVIIDVMQN